MLTPWRRHPRATTTLSRRLISDARPFREHDHILLRPARDPNASPLLRGPLKPGKNIQTHKGVVLHDDIIGKRVRDNVTTVPAKSGKPSAEFRLYAVSLEEYVRLSRRLVTPIYPADANLIVSLLDLHPDVYDANAEEGGKLEILEAGTGHGALTLYLSRAIHAANPPKPALETVAESEDDAEEAAHTALQAWKARRRAVIHTTDIAHQYSKHAHATVRAFRQGLYADNVDFHVGDVSAWLAKTAPTREGPFLTAAFLDLPSAEKHLAAAAEVLRVDGTLVVFNPSITQIMDCAKRVKEEGVGLVLERVVELGVNGGSGGREWDVRPVRPRADRKKADVSAGEVVSEEGGSGDAAVSDTPAMSSDDAGESASESDTPQSAPETDPIGESRSPPEPEADGKWSMVCRPRVGDRVVGGGFLGVWKKQRV